MNGPTAPTAPGDTKPLCEPVPAANPLADRIREYLDGWRGWWMGSALLAVLDEHQIVTYPAAPFVCGEKCTGCPITMCQSCGGGGDGEECITVHLIARALRLTVPDNAADTAGQRGRSASTPPAREESDRG
ncbi:MAG TPA: hypothetical protein VM677_23170 [Actinokineospora sp.]|nr:hypothetical protein [Actinokineospora sp.]